MTIPHLGKIHLPGRGGRRSPAQLGAGTAELGVEWPGGNAKRGGQGGHSAGAKFKRKGPKEDPPIEQRRRGEPAARCQREAQVASDEKKTWMRE